MNREDVEEHVSEALSCPVLARRLQGIIEGIEANVPGDNTKAMMYELVDVILQMGQRVRALETRIVAYSVEEELSRRSVHAPRREINYERDFPRADEKAKHRR